MKTKYLLTALALPAMFAACSQEDILTGEGFPQSSELQGKVAGDVAFKFNPESRLVWGATGGQVWEENDEFSLFWVADDKGELVNEDESLDGMINALYKKDGNIFTSENILYVGKHLMVYPVNKSHFTNKDIVVEVGATQDGSIALGKRSVYTNESLLTIDAMPEEAENKVNGIIYAAGYKQPVVAEVKPLSSNLVLNLNFDMPASINEVTIKSVSLVADKNIFSPKGYLTADDDKIGFAGTDKTGKIVLKMPEGTKVTKSNGGTYVAQIALLPVFDYNEAAKYSIEVLTNYGVVTINKAKYVTNGDGLYYSADNTLEAQKAPDFEIGEAALDLDEEMKLTTQNGLKFTYRGVERTLDAASASYGKRITANVKVMMTEASISNMKVSNSQELIDAYNTYNLLAKTGDESFVLSNEKPFEMTPEAVAKILSNNKVTLTQESNDTIKLTGAHTAIPSFTVKDAVLFDTQNTKLLLGDDASWTLDVDAAAEANMWAEIINGGELTIIESNPTEGAVALAKPVTNCGTVEFGSDVEMLVAYKQTEDGETSVPASTKVDLSNGGDIAGNVNIAKNGGLYANKGIVYVAENAKVKVAGSFLTASTANMHNLGEVTLEGEGTVYVSTNAEGNKMGTIILAKRNSSAKVEDANAQGYIKWPCDLDIYSDRNIDDAFNTLVLSKDLRIGGNAATSVNYVEIAGAKVNIYPNSNSELNWNRLKAVVVEEGKTLVVPKGTSLTSEKTINNGRIEVFGSYVTKAEEGKGKIYYYNGQKNVANVADLKAAIADQNASLIVLTQSLTLEEALTINKNVTIDLGGNTVTFDATNVTGTSAAFIVESGNVTFKNGEVNAVQEWADSERTDDAGNNVSIYAIYAKEGVVNIETGVYKTGSDKMTAYNGQLAGTPVIGLGENATANISGGEFEALYPCSNETGEYVYIPLRISKGTWIVTGGTYAKYNPAAAIDLTAVGGNASTDSILRSGYTTVNVTNTVTGADETADKADTQFVVTWTQGRKYTVGESK